MEKGHNDAITELNYKIVELSSLYEIARRLGASVDPKATLSSVLEILSESMGMSRGTLTLLDPETKQLYIEFAHGLTPEERSRGIYRIGEGITGKVVESGEPIIVPDIGKEPLFLNRTRSRGDIKRENISFICVPVKVKGDTVGVLSVDRLFTDQSVSPDEDVRILTIIASLIGQAITTAKMVEMEKKNLLKEKLTLQRELKSPYRFANIVFVSDKMRDVLDSAWRVSQSKANVLLRGESGTGKELIARTIHYHSKRCDKAFISVNCAAIPDTLIESDLFGHVKGAFTGAVTEKKGRFEMADGGTLFLDEIGDIPPPMQVKLLRVLQERRFERVGSSKSITVDVRIIAATNRNLEEAVKEGKFREDLYYRLNVVPLRIPSLRERKEDIPPLVGHFLQLYNEENGREVKISNEALDTLLIHDWPGNVRELENCIERMIVMAKNDLIMTEDVPITIDTNISDNRSDESDLYGQAKTLDHTIENMEKERITEALKRAGYVQAKAARQLGITSRQIGYKIKKYRITSS